MKSPRLYSTFLLWLLSELFEQLPEVGDPDKPKMVFFFDEAHLLFDDAPKALIDKVEQVVKLIRSKGVGVYFVTQNPIDIRNPCWPSSPTACSTRCAPIRRASRRL
jgi:DNA helicase HerA-like ATPase